MQILPWVYGCTVALVGLISWSVGVLVATCLIKGDPEINELDWIKKSLLGFGALFLAALGTTLFLFGIMLLCYT